MVFDEKPPLMQTTTDFILDDKKTQLRMGSDPRPIEAGIAELQRKWIYPRPELDPILNESSFHKRGCMDPSNDFLLAWGKIIQDYTDRGLTNKSDRLIAIQGVAQAAAAVAARTYFAGIWVDTPHSIFMGLLWCVSAVGSRNRGRTGVAPSWSWASVSSQVIWLGHWLCRLESRITIVGLQKQGALSKTEGELTMDVNIRPAMVEDGYVAQLTDWEDENRGHGHPERMSRQENCSCHSR